MRTTLTIADDVLVAVKERARRERRSAGDVLTDLARTALTSSGGGADGVEEFHGFRPFPRRGAAVSNELIDLLREDESE